jgi:hypothetical protein
VPLPTARPEAVLAAVADAFFNGDIWLKALADPDAHYQRMALMYRYVDETPAGFVLTDLGRQEIGQK